MQARKYYHTRPDPREFPLDSKTTDQSHKHLKQMIRHIVGQHCVTKLKYGMLRAQLEKDFDITVSHRKQEVHDIARKIVDEEYVFADEAKNPDDDSEEDTTQDTSSDDSNSDSESEESMGTVQHYFYLYARTAFLSFARNNAYGLQHEVSDDYFNSMCRNWAKEYMETLDSPNKPLDDEMREDIKLYVYYLTGDYMEALLAESD